MNHSAQLVEQSVSFGEYEDARNSGEYPAAMTQEDLLMALFAKKGIRMIEGKQITPVPPVEIETDISGKKFVIRQVQGAQ